MSERPEYHAEGLDERGIFGGRAYPERSTNEHPYGVYVKTALDQVADGQGTEREQILADEVVRLTKRAERAEAALRGLQDANGCFGGCDWIHGFMEEHTPACAAARSVVARGEARGHPFADFPVEPFSPTGAKPIDPMRRREARDE